MFYLVGTFLLWITMRGELAAYYDLLGAKAPATAPGADQPTGIPSVDKLLKPGAGAGMSLP